VKKIRQRTTNTNVHLVLNGYNDSFTPSLQKQKKCDLLRPFTIVSHGNFGRFQNVDFINQLVKKTKHLPLRFVFVGFGAKFDQIIPAPNVEIVRAVSHKKIPALLATADLGLSVRSSDSVGRNAIPVKVLEYVGVGIPSLVIPVTPDLNDLEQQGAIKQFEGDDFEAVIDFLTNMINRGTDFESMCRDVKAIRQDYSRRRWVDIAIRHILEGNKKLGYR